MSAQDMATLPASTKRPPSAVGGKVSSPVTYLTDLLAVPLLPADSDLAEEGQLKNPREGKVSYIFPASGGNILPDIAEGDLLVIGSTEYLIHLVKEWPRPDGGSFVEVLMTQRKVSA